MIEAVKSNGAVNEGVNADRSVNQAVNLSENTTVAATGTVTEGRSR